jgi:hypothetical protein
VRFTAEMSNRTDGTEIALNHNAAGGSASPSDLLDHQHRVED